MAELNPKRIIKANINGGQQYQDNDGVQAQAITDVIEGVLYSDTISDNALQKSTTAESNSSSAISIATNADTKSNTAISNSNTAVSVSNEAKQAATVASAFSNSANENSQIARGLAQSVVDRADSGEFKGDRGESGVLVPLETGFFRMELREDGHLWVIAQDGATNPLRIENGNLILTI